MQRNELERCFKWLGAPWYGGECPNAESVAHAINRGYTAEHVEIFTLLPLDLVEGLAPIEFGPWRIREFTRAEFSAFVGLDSLRRFGSAFEPDVERLHRLSWLILRRLTKPWFQRTATLLNFDLSDVGVVEPSPRAFDAEVERGLFVLALYPWEDHFSDQSSPWRPFSVPWTYTISKHVFEFPPRAPNSDMLTWTLAGSPDDEVWEVPAVANYFEAKDRPALQQFVSKWWDLVNQVTPFGLESLKAFNPHVEHFFLRGFLESKIDQLLWHVTAIDAAIGKEATSVASKLARRILALTKNDNLASEFKSVHYKRRSELVHGKDLSNGKLRESDLTAVRRVAREVVANLIEFVARRPGWTRDQLIRFLDR